MVHFMRKITLILLLIIISINCYSQTFLDVKDVDKKVSIRKQKSKNIKSKPETIVIGNKLNITNLNNLNKAGIALNITGFTLAMGGTALFLYDYLGYTSVIKEANTYEEYRTVYAVDLTLFISSLSSIAIGSGLIIASIPMFVYKGKGENVSLFIQTGLQNKVGMSIYF